MEIPTKLVIRAEGEQVLASLPEDPEDPLLILSENEVSVHGGATGDDAG